MSTSALAALDDAALLQRAKTDPVALDVLLQRYASAAVAMSYSLCGQREDALDAAQVALLELSREILTHWRGQSLKMCLYVHARKAVLKARQRDAARKQRELITAERREASIMSKLEQQETLAALREELTQLPDQTAAVLALYHLDELPVATVAAQTGISVDACKQRLSRGREELRQRLERRGMTLGSLALLESLLDSAFAAGRIFAAELSSAQLAGLAQQAGAVARTSAMTQTLHVHPPEATPKLNSGAQGEHLSMTVKSVALVTIAVALVAVSAFLTPRTVKSDTSVAALTEHSSIGVSSKTTPQIPLPPGFDAQERTLSSPPPKLASRWQTPRFIKWDGRPDSIAVSGQRAAILTSSASGLSLLESTDGGQNWKGTHALKGYTSGAVSIDAAGNCLLLGAVSVKEQNASLFGLMNTERTRNIRVEWSGRTGPGEFTAPQALWAVEAPGTLSLVKVLASPTGTWALAKVRGLNTEKQNPSLKLAFIPTQGTPRQVSLPASATENYSARAFTFGPRGLGLVSVSSDEKRMACALTQDEGATWTSHSIPLPEDGCSGLSTFGLVPLGAICTGQKVSILYEQVLKPANSRNLSEMKKQLCLAVSPDLCQSWAQPRPVSAAIPFFSVTSHEFFQSLHGVGQALVVCRHTISANLLPPSVKSASRALISEDDGKSWYNLHAFDAIGTDSSFYAAGGDGAALHVAFVIGRKDYKRNDPNFVIRSFADGNWLAPQHPHPSWYKEEKLPEPTLEGF